MGSKGRCESQTLWEAALANTSPWVGPLIKSRAVTAAEEEPDPERGPVLGDYQGSSRLYTQPDCYRGDLRLTNLLQRKLGRVASGADANWTQRLIEARIPETLYENFWAFQEALARRDGEALTRDSLRGQRSRRFRSMNCWFVRSLKPPVTSATIQETVESIRRIQPKTQLHLGFWVHHCTGVQITTPAVCTGHTASFDLFGRQFLDRRSLALWHDPRGSSNSSLSAIDTHLVSQFYPRHGTRILGGSMAQSEQLYRRAVTLFRTAKALSVPTAWPCCRSARKRPGIRSARPSRSWPHR